MSLMSVFYPRHGEAVTPHATNVQNFSALYVGVSGDLEIVLADDALASPVILKSVPIGFVPLEVMYVLAANTTATNIIGFRAKG